MRIGRLAVASIATMLAIGAASAAPDLTGITVRVVSFTPARPLSGGTVEIHSDRQKPVKFVIVSCTVVDEAGQKIGDGGPVVVDIGVGQTVKSEFNMSGADRPGTMTCAITTLFD